MNTNFSDFLREASISYMEEIDKQKASGHYGTYECEECGSIILLPTVAYGNGTRECSSCGLSEENEATYFVPVQLPDGQGGMQNIPYSDQIKWRKNHLDEVADRATTSAPLNPFPAKPITQPPAHYFARAKETASLPSKSEPEPYVPTDAEINTMAEQIVRDRRRKYDEISDAVHYGQAYLDGQYAGHEDGYANRTRWVPVAGYAFVFPDNLPESYVIEEHRAWVDGYADGYDVGAASAIWYREHPDYNGRKGRSQRQTEVDLVVQQMIGTRSTIY